MLIRCSDNCRFQNDGFCGLKNIYSAEVTSSSDQLNDSGCVYFKPKVKPRKKDNQRGDEPPHKNSYNFMQ